MLNLMQGVTTRGSGVRLRGSMGLRIKLQVKQEQPKTNLMDGSGVVPNLATVCGQR